MALPTSTDLQTMDYSYAGQPFVNVPSKATIDTGTMDWSYAGLPFVTNPPQIGPVHIATWCGVPMTNIQTLNGVQLANIATIDGIS